MWRKQNSFCDTVHSYKYVV